MWRGQRFFLVVLSAWSALRCGNEFSSASGTGAAAGAGGTGAAAATGNAEAGTDSGGSSGRGVEDGGSDTGGSPTSSDAGEGGTGASPGSSGAGGAPPVEDVSVRGKLSYEFGGPLSGWRVFVAGQETLTDENGEFVVPDVAEKYDLLVAPTNQHLRAYLGLTTRAPVVVMSSIAGDPGWTESSAQVSGTVSDLEGARACRIDLWLGERRAFTLHTDVPPDWTSVNYGPVDLAWFQERDVALEVTAVCDVPSYLLRAGGAASALGDGWVKTDASIALDGVTAREVTASAELAAGLTLSSLTLCENSWCHGGVTNPVVSKLAAGDGIRDARVEANGTHADGKSLTQKRVPDGVSEVTLPLTVPPKVASPSAGATGVSPTTLYTWSSYGSGTHLLKVSAAGYLLEVYTSGISFKLANLGLSEADYVEGVEHSWQLFGVGPILAMDDLVSGETLLDAKGIEYLTTSPVRKFTP